MEGLDIHNLDLSDPLQFAVFRWTDSSTSSWNPLPPSGTAWLLSHIIIKMKVTSLDREIVDRFGSWTALANEINSILISPASTPEVKRHMAKVHSLPRSIFTLTSRLEQSVSPHDLDFRMLWGLIYMILKLTILGVKQFSSYATPYAYASHPNRVYSTSVSRVLKFSDQNPVGPDLSLDGDWTQFRKNIDCHIQTLKETVVHIGQLQGKLTSNLKVAGAELSSLPSIKKLQVGDHSHESTVGSVLPFQRHPSFYGRQTELDRLLTYIGPENRGSFEAYAIYGRRGVGKTALALRFAYDSIDTKTYDLVFWIQSETFVTVRQSFSSIAKVLHLQEDTQGGQDEEIVVAVHEWLRNTDKHWLLIFDNIGDLIQNLFWTNLIGHKESEKILRLYWPTRISRGSVLVTSRDYHPFLKDLCIRGDTLKPFDNKQSWELLLELLGRDWLLKFQGNDIPLGEMTAGKAMLLELEGLALAIEQTANLIKDKNIGGPTISKTFETFKLRVCSLPERYSTPRTASERTLDALWDVIFQSLTRKSRALLGLVAWLSPDGIPVDMLHLKKGSVLYTNPAWPRYASTAVDTYDRVALWTVLTSKTDLDEAVDQLLERKLIKRHFQHLSIHRSVQEAVNYRSVQGLQDTFHVASFLLHERFPPRLLNQTLYHQWNLCSQYIHHVVYMSKAFSALCKPGLLTASHESIDLLDNAAWYLYEIGDYDTCGSLTTTGLLACQNVESMAKAHLLLTDGCRWYEMNNLVECRRVWEESMRIREKLLPRDHPELAAIHNNLGNLEAAVGNLEAAIPHYHRAQNIWIQGGDTMQETLAISYLNLGRLYTLKGMLDKALEFTAKSNTTVQKVYGPKAAFMVHIHYAYGKIYSQQNQWDLARASYTVCLEMALEFMPTHPVTSAVWYSLACLDFTEGSNESALIKLEKSKLIAEMRSPIRNDGTIARLLWKMAVVVESSGAGSHVAQAAILRSKAEKIKQELVVASEGGAIRSRDGLLISAGEHCQEESSYDALVPLFFR
ncbi:hypothetical protein DL98DRAFT_633450 [Cadophora sp. DSE1049]|nr:hypothetical protein DL98DRAFT_633450 [Cadophora sp. DSE1049]